MGKKAVRRSVSMPQEIHTLLVQLAGQRGHGVTEADLIREALRAFLDEQTDVVGSNRHFQKSLQTRLDQLETALTFHLNVLLYLLAAFVGDEGDDAIDDAIVAAKRDGDALLEQIQAVRDLSDVHE